MGVAGMNAAGWSGNGKGAPQGSSTKRRDGDAGSSIKEAEPVRLVERRSPTLGIMLPNARLQRQRYYVYT